VCALCVTILEQSQYCRDGREDFFNHVKANFLDEAAEALWSICTGLKTVANHTSLQAEAKQHLGVCNQLVGKKERP